jgi:hypothetical protein
MDHIRRQQVRRGAVVTMVVFMLCGALAGPALAEPPLDTSGSVTITGLITTTCALDADAITVKAQPLTMGGLFRTTTAYRTSGGFAYRLQSLSRTGYRVTPAVATIPLACGYGRWWPPSRLVDAPPTASTTITGINFAFQVPRQHAVDGVQLAAVLGFYVARTSIHLDNRCTWLSRLTCSQLFVDVPDLDGTGSSDIDHRFEIPRTTVNVKVCWLCPSIGSMTLYVNDVNSSGLVVRWEQNRGLVADLTFESGDTEILGVGTGVASLILPEIEVDNGRVRISLPIVADNAGSITYSLSPAPMFSAAVRVGGCELLGYDFCPGATSVLAQVKAAVEPAVKTGLDDRALHAGVGAALHAYLAPGLHDAWDLPRQLGRGDISIDRVVTTPTQLVFLQY